MRMRLVTPALIFAFVLAGVLVTAVANRTNAQSEREALAPEQYLTSPKASFRTESSPAIASTPSVQPEISFSQTPVELSQFAMGSTVDEIELRLLARNAPLQLTDEQWADFARVTGHYQAIRQAYEATIARVTRSKQGHYRVEIPAYSAAGDALRAKFEAEMREKLGEPAASEIASALGRSLDGHFAGFGVSVQTLEFNLPDGAADSEQYEVTRTIQFWNSVDAAQRLTTRRETHFPGLEDPDGHRWGPFLSLLVSQRAVQVGS
jgi:hypothetical protein